MDGKKEIELTVPRTVIVNDTIFTLTLALSGFSVAYMFDALARPYLDEGTLVQVLPRSALSEPPLSLYFPRYANEQPKLRAFIDTAKAVLRKRR